MTRDDVDRGLEALLSGCQTDEERERVLRLVSTRTDEALAKLNAMADDVGRSFRPVTHTTMSQQMHDAWRMHRTNVLREWFP